jgi:hypothetical protein
MLSREPDDEKILSDAAYTSLGRVLQDPYLSLDPASGLALGVPGRGQGMKKVREAWRGGQDGK